MLVWSEMRQDEVAPGFSLGAPEVADTTFTSLKGVELIVTSPTKNSVVTSPLIVTGEAPGFWYFEATFPLAVVNWDGLIIGEGYAQAQDEWMTQELVPFVGTIEFYEPLAQEGRQAVVGGLILQRDNPSGLPQNDDAVEFQIRFAE